MKERSEHVAENSRRRATFHLLTGGLIGTIGVSFFYLFLHSDLREYDNCIALHISKPSIIEPCYFPLIVHLFQRLAVLTFVEVLAGFFLKYYRTALEEYRYFETVARRREAVVTSFLTYIDFGDDKVLLDFCRELQKVPGLGKLSRGETTSILEAGKISENDFLTLVSLLANLAKEARSIVTPEAVAKSDSDK